MARRVSRWLRHESKKASSKKSTNFLSSFFFRFDEHTFPSNPTFIILRRALTKIPTIGLTMRTRHVTFSHASRFILFSLFFFFFFFTINQPIIATNVFVRYNITFLSVGRLGTLPTVRVFSLRCLLKKSILKRKTVFRYYRNLTIRLVHPSSCSCANCAACKKKKKEKKVRGNTISIDAIVTRQPSNFSFSNTDAIS